MSYLSETAGDHLEARLAAGIPKDVDVCIYFISGKALPTFRRICTNKTIIMYFYTINIIGTFRN